MLQGACLILGGILAAILLLPALLVRGCLPGRPEGGPEVALYLAGSGRLLRLRLEDYLAGVIAAEVPARFHPEALKAQAVAARTAAVNRMKRFGGRGCRHCPSADLCDRPEDGQAWLSWAELRKRWGWRYPWYKARIERAVRETRGILIFYGRRPIEAVYHSTCGGRTEEAADVWGRDLPYLRSVACGYDGASPRLRSEVRIDWREAARRLGLAGKAAGPPGDLAVLARTASGRVARFRMWGRAFTGPAFRSAFGLRSTDFSARLEGRWIVFTVRGNGHGVGLCQYGAEGLAERGADFRRILLHYYPGTRLERLEGD